MATSSWWATSTFRTLRSRRWPRARLAGYADKPAADADGGLAADADYDDFLSEAEEEAARLAKELDEELAELLDADGDVLTF